MSTAPPPAPLTPLTVTTTTPQPSGTIKAAWTEAQVKDRMFWFKGFKDNKKGGVIFDDKDVLKKQQGVVKDIMLQLGAQLLSGKLAVRLSLPIRLFEPRSLLERIPDAWAYAPTLLAKAAHATEALDRLQHVMAFVVAGLHFCVGQSKPFNPILGETYQSTFPDGTSVYLEHVQHHPPVSAYYVEGPLKLFTLSGQCEFEAHLAANTLVNAQTGTVKVQFANGSEVQYAMPKFKMHGVVLGERMFEFTGECHFHDVSSDLRGTLDMDGNSSFLGRSHHDDITGTIVAPATKGAKPHVVAKLTGSWLNHLHANGVVLWDMATSPVYLHVPVATPLPSDVRFRADLISLKQGDMDEAQRQKIVMEEDQRRDHRLRGHDDGGGNKRHSTPKR
ncbi:hypothetical protein, variant [Aphanomyces astaci]|uniref:Oxysterol-binding protein n=1 Tax=Aphanomyces astaci TaxID=112090 RepID=W4G4Y9_APHAT|nr:hypothetical protein, variant [Aphanomyces astaci]ETV74361.1 hypothetical protein, variant [Aphanomyces astaci]|eukprot:XP_009836019.1 hypothetical protein, variant [Aphanomyces astaci]